MLRCLWLFLVLGCSGSEDAVPIEPPVARADAEELPVGAATPPAVAAHRADRYAASHVLVAHAEAERAPAGVTRSRAEAQVLATRILAEARGGAELEALARQHSDGPSGPRGGGLGVFLAGTMMPAFEDGVATVREGELVPEVVETPYGMHVIRRDAVVRRHLMHVVVPHEDAWRSPSNRTRQEAFGRAKEALAALEGGQAFGEVAAMYSEDSVAASGGDLGWVHPGELIPDFETAAFLLEPGETSDVVETPYGFHVIRRVE